MILRIAIVASLLSCAAAAAEPARVDPPAHYAQIATEVAPGVHALHQAEPAFAGVVGNITVIEQSDGIVLIDTGSSYGVGRRAVEFVRRTSPKRVKAVAITHWHNDHPLGLAAIRDAWPDVEIIAHEATAADMATRMGSVPRARSAEYEAERVRQLTEAFDKTVPELAAKAATDAERAGWAKALETRASRLADIPGTYAIMPTRTFKDRLVLADRDAPIELVFLGRANTPGDTSAWLPKQGVLVAGDVVVEPVPYMFNVYPTEILSVLDRMRALDYQVLVPGHGAPLKDHAFLDKLSALVRETQRQVGPLAKANVPLDQIAGRTDFSAQRAAFAGSDAWLGYWFGEYALTPLIESAYREARGEPLGPEPVTAP